MLGRIIRYSMILFKSFGNEKRNNQWRVGTEMELIDSGHYFRDYDTEQRFLSYFHQIDGVLKLKPHKILEIGIGNSFVANYLKGEKLNIATLDIDPGLNPDVVGSVTNTPFSSDRFDVVASFECLEHIQYTDALCGFREMVRCSKKYIFISLPDATPFISFSLDIGGGNEVSYIFSLPLTRGLLPRPKNSGDHHWEIGRGKYKLKKIISDFKTHNVKLLWTRRYFQIPYHRFFLFEKTCIRDGECFD